MNVEKQDISQNLKGRFEKGDDSGLWIFCSILGDVESCMCLAKGVHKQRNKIWEGIMYSTFTHIETLCASRKLGTDVCLKCLGF